MTQTPSLIAKRVQDFVPIWDLIADGVYVGSMTDLPDEGPMATVTVDGISVTVSGPTLYYCLATAKDAYFNLTKPLKEVSL